MKMPQKNIAQGPVKGALHKTRRIIDILVGMLETRVKLAIIEIEEEKINIFQLLMMAGLSLLFIAFGLLTLFVLLLWEIDPSYRLIAFSITTTVLLGIGLIIGLMAWLKVKRATFMKETRKQLAQDRKLLEGNKE